MARTSLAELAAVAGLADRDVVDAAPPVELTFTRGSGTLAFTA